MAYYTETIPEKYKEYYEWKKRTLNSYWCLRQEAVEAILDIYKRNPYVYCCTYKGEYACKRCGNCLRAYYETKERMKNG
jgi:hypothetical protein